jgi:hypothetical protein
MTTGRQEMSEQIAAGKAARAILRRATTASLATRLAGAADSQPGWPYASLVLAATDHAARPLLLLSDLAVHTQALKADGSSRSRTMPCWPALWRAIPARRVMRISRIFTSTG